MTVIMVEDPTRPGHQAPKSWVMRNMYEAGTSISDIARHFETDYRTAYKAINPERLPVDHPRSTRPKKLDKSRLSSMSKSELEKIVYTRAKTSEQKARVRAASDELDRRFPGWND